MHNKAFTLGIVLLLFFFTSCGDRHLDAKNAKKIPICITMEEKIIFSQNTIGEVDKYFGLILGNNAFKYFVNNKKCDIFAKVGNDDVLIRTKMQDHNFQTCLEVEEVEVKNRFTHHVKLINSEDKKQLKAITSQVFKF